MNDNRLPIFVVLPLTAAFLLPLFGKKGKSLAMLVANLVTIFLLALSISCIGQEGIYEVGKWPIPLGINMVLDGLSALVLLTICVVSAAVMLYSTRYMEQYTAKSKFLSLFLLMVTGLNGAVLSGDIFNLFVFLEIASLTSYALVGFGCRDDELEAAFKYMVLGEVASMLVLFAIAIVYANTGALNMAYISKALAGKSLNPSMAFALVLFISSFGLKSALVPFHAWLPDAHSSAPTPISAMLSGVFIKGLGVYALVRVIFNIFSVSIPLGWILIILGIVSMVVGVFLAVGQWDFKRLLAYHSISQMGYVILGVGMGALILAQNGSVAWASMAILGGLFHLANHAVFKSLLFLTSGSVEMSTGTRHLKELGGLAEKLPFTRAACAIASASIAGVPPFNGFWSKLLLVIAAVQSQMYWLAVITVIVSLVTLISFLKVQRYIFLGELPENLSRIKEHRGSMLFGMLALACLCVIMGLLLIPQVRAVVLDPAVKVLTDGLLYSSKIIGSGVN